MSFKAFISKTTAKARSGVDKVSVTVKLYAKKNALSDKLSNLYDTLGKICYFNTVGESGEMNTEDIDVIIQDITVTRKELSDIEEEIRNRSGKKLCTQCGMEMQREVSFCPYCGSKADTAVDDSGESVNNKVDIEVQGEDIF